MLLAVLQILVLFSIKVLDLAVPVRNPPNFDTDHVIVTWSFLCVRIHTEGWLGIPTAIQHIFDSEKTRTNSSCAADWGSNLESCNPLDPEVDAMPTEPLCPKDTAVFNIKPGRRRKEMSSVIETAGQLPF